jgi:hypothetical protein
MPRCWRVGSNGVADTDRSGGNADLRRTGLVLEEVVAGRSAEAVSIAMQGIRRHDECGSELVEVLRVPGRVLIQVMERGADRAVGRAIRAKVVRGVADADGVLAVSD